VKLYGNPTSAWARSLVKPITVELATGLGPTVSIRTFVHADIKDRFVSAVTDACMHTKWLPTEMQAYNVRAIRGGTSWSLHSWALAWDCFGRTGPIDPITGRCRPPDDWFAVFEEHKFEWGGRWKKADPHHVEWSR
jgi:hypothetical protein